jgi:uncharacterized protein DUF1186
MGFMLRWRGDAGDGRMQILGKDGYMSRERALELVEIFDWLDGTYKREEVEEALTLRNEITPLLIRVLEDVVADPQTYADEERFAHNYAVAILAHFEEPSAHLPIIKAFSLPREQLDWIWGDMVTERLPALLCRTAGGNYDAVKTLVLNREAEEFVRASAMESVMLAVARGELSRDEAISFYATLFDESLAESDDYFWSAIVGDLLDLYPGELIQEIRGLYDKGLAREGDISRSEIEEVMDDGLENALAKLPEKLSWRIPDGVHSYISWFACFHEHEQGAAAANPLFREQKKKKEKARIKRKQSKAAKRKNRK